jgi:general secretion pathway protein F
MLFQITALSNGQRIELKAEALNAKDARTQARAKGLTVLRVRPANKLWPRLLRSQERFPLLLFSQELLALLSSGLSLVESIQTLNEKETRPNVRRVLTDLLQRLRAGESFSSAISQEPNAFPSLFVATAKASEQTGDLSHALRRYVSYQERIELVRKKIISASLYPLILLVLGTSIAVFLLGYVTPRFAALYSENLDSLPLGSRILLSWGVFIEANALQALVLFLALAGLFAYLLGLSAVRARLAGYMWRAPKLGKELRAYHLTRFYRTVGMLLQAGIPIIAAIDMAADLLHPELRHRLSKARSLIRAGQTVSHAMEHAGLTTPVALRMMRVGEKSGRMSEMMEAAAAFHDEETSRFVEWFSRLFEPLLMVVIGLVIGAIVILLYMPIFDLAGSLQ